MPTALRGHECTVTNQELPRHWQRYQIDPPWPKTDCRIIRRPSPNPILRFRTQPATYRIIVKLLDLPEGCLHAHAKPWAWLPGGAILPNGIGSGMAHLTIPAGSIADIHLGVSGRARSLEEAAESSPGRQPWEPSHAVQRQPCPGLTPWTTVRRPFGTQHLGFEASPTGSTLFTCRIVEISLPPSCYPCPIRQGNDAPICRSSSETDRSTRVCRTRRCGGYAPTDPWR